MGESFDPLRALGEIPPSHIGRLRFVPAAKRSLVTDTRLGIIFVIASWSGPSIMAFAELKRILPVIDPQGRLEVIVVDTDDCSELRELPEFEGKLHGWGEAAWIKDGEIVFTSGMGYHPERFESLTARLLES